MTVSSTPSRWEYTGTGAQVAFTVNNKFFEDTDLTVYEDGTVQVLDTDYTVALNADQDASPGGTVTFLSAPANGLSVIIVRDVANTQETDLPLGGPFPSTAVEGELDRRTIISQQQDEEIGRSLRYRPGLPAVDGTLPTLADLKGNVLGFDATTGLPIAVAGTIGDAGDLVSAYAATLLDDGTRETFLTTLGLNAVTAVAGTYAVANTDKAKVLACSGATLYTVSLAAASGFDADFTVKIRNESTSRGKTIAPNGVTSFILWPLQSVTISRSGSAWMVDPPAQRWVLAANMQFNVDPLGSDSNDGLGTGATGAFLTIQKAINVIGRGIPGGAAIDCNNKSVTISLAAGTYDPVTVNGGIIGSHVFSVIGDVVTPANVVWRTTNALVPIIDARDLGIIQVKGVRFSATVGGATFLSAAQNAIIDIETVEFGSGATAVHCYAEGGSINVTGSYAIVSTAFTYHMFSRYSGSLIKGGGGLTVTVAAATFTDFWTAQYGATITAGGSAITFAGAGAGAGSTGRKYIASVNGNIELDSSTLPGATAGTTATGGQVSA